MTLTLVLVVYLSTVFGKYSSIVPFSICSVMLGTGQPVVSHVTVVGCPSFTRGLIIDVLYGLFPAIRNK